jgi:hypothetical protein
MDTRDVTDRWNDSYALWHIPSSTLLVTTVYRDEIVRRVQRVITDGIDVEDLMLQITPKDELIGHQLLGAHIFEAFSGRDGCERAMGTA